MVRPPAKSNASMNGVRGFVFDCEIERYFGQVRILKCRMGWDGWHKNNPLHRRAVKQLLRNWGLYEEWSESDVEAGSVNETGSDDVAF